MDFPEKLRLIFPHPQQLGRGKARKGNICGKGGQLFFSHRLIQVFHLPCGTAVIPQNRGADHTVFFVQNHQTMHLSACADSLHLAGVKAVQQLGDAREHRLFPILRILLAPTRFRKLQRVFFRYNIFDPALPVRQQQLDGGGAKIDSDIQHNVPLYFFPDLRLVTTSKITASKSTPPLITYCQVSPRPIMDMPMLITPRSRAPITTPPTVPLPP